MRISAEVAQSEPDYIAKSLRAVGVDVTAGKNGIDYSFRCDCNMRSVFVERKEVGDLLHAFTTGAQSGESRLMNQLRAMAARAGPNDLCVLLLEGHLRNQGGYAAVNRRKSGIPFDAVDNFLIAVQKFGFRIAHSHSAKYTAGRLVSIAKNWLGLKEAGPIIRLPKAPTPQLRTLMTFPDIGMKRAKGLLEEYGTLECAISALCEGRANLGKKRQEKMDKYMFEEVKI